MADDDADHGKRSKRTIPGYSDPTRRKASASDSPARDTDVELSTALAAAPDDPPEPPRLVDANGRPSAPPSLRRRGTPLIEIEVVHEHGPAPKTDRPWKLVEIWTRNRVYTLDSGMHCIEVNDRGTREPVDGHPFIGLRMVGGQHRDGETIELSHPFPRPGTEAVFEHGHGHGGSFSRTSPVTRVILRLHIVTVAPNHVVPTWEDISGAFEAP